MNYLENNILRLRAPEPSDVDLLYKWENDTSVWTAGITIVPFSKFILEKYIETAHLDIYQTQQLRLMIDVVSENYRTIGTIDLFDFDAFNNRAGIGILIANSSDRNKGYASQALQMVIQYSFKILGLHQLFCNIAKDNQVSIKLFQNQGFQIVGLKKEWSKVGTEWQDEYLLQLINV